MARPRITQTQHKNTKNVKTQKHQKHRNAKTQTYQNTNMPRYQDTKYQDTKIPRYEDTNTKIPMWPCWALPYIPRPLVRALVAPGIYYVRVVSFGFMLCRRLRNKMPCYVCNHWVGIAHWAIPIVVGAPLLGLLPQVAAGPSGTSWRMRWGNG
jgi:hypothetical protein